METTIFSRIAAREIEAYIIWEDDTFVAFLDVLPIAHGHVVVAPKQVYEDLESVPVEMIGPFFKAAQHIGAAMLSGLGAEGYSIFIDNKNGANQHIPHVHFHVVPRSEEDGLGRWPQEIAYAEGEAEAYATKLKGNL